MADKKLKILVIDDEVTQRMLVKEYLEEAGHLVRQADDGRRGLKMATSTAPDVILLDVMLPSIDGFDLCRSLKEHPVTANTPVILITASREGDVIARGLAAGADDFVTKPVDWEFLADRVAHVARKSMERTHLLQMVEVRPGIGSDDYVPSLRQEQSLAGIDELIQGAELQAGQAAAQAAAEMHALKAEFEQEFARLKLENERLVAMARVAVQQAQAAAEKTYGAEIAEIRAAMEQERAAASEREEADRTALGKRNTELKALREAFDAERRRFEAEISSLRDQLAAMPTREALEAPWSVVLRAATWQASLASALATRTKSLITAGGRLDMARLQELDRTAETLSTAIANAKRFAHTMSTAGECKPGDVRIDRLVADIANQAKPIATRARVELRTNIGSNAPVVIADEARLRYAWICLIVNAIRFTPPGGRVTLEAIPDADGGIRLQVTDTGVGMSTSKADELNRIIDMPTPQLRAGEPAGLGVATAAALARQMGGSVEFDSRQGSGTRAAVVFPPNCCGAVMTEAMAV